MFTRLSLVILITLAMAGGARAQTRLHSADHDELVLVIGRSPVPGRAPGRSTPRIAARLVTVCLDNATRTAKGIGIRRNGPPGAMAPPGHNACLWVEPTGQTLYFFKADGTGGLRAVLSAPLDLRGRDGMAVAVDWLKDAPD